MADPITTQHEEMTHIIALAESLKATINAYGTAHPYLDGFVYVSAVRAILSQVETQWHAHVTAKHIQCQEPASNPATARPRPRTFLDIQQPR